jgi:hypothetical protein
MHQQLDTRNEQLRITKTCPIKWGQIKLPNTLRILVTAATPEKQNTKKSLRGGGILLGRKNHFQI